jgi:hypothetical protein
MAVLWGVAPCFLIDIDQRFGNVSCLHHYGDDRGSKLLKRRSVSTRLHGATSHKAAMFFPIRFLYIYEGPRDISSFLLLSEASRNFEIVVEFQHG